VQATGLAARNGARIHITAFGDTAMAVGGNARRDRLGQKSTAHKQQAYEQKSSHQQNVQRVSQPMEMTG